MTKIDLIVENMRHEKTPITRNSWVRILGAINEKKPHAVNPANWGFNEESLRLCHYLIMKLSTRLFNATTHVNGNNGFVVLRITNDDLDKIPDIARVHANTLLANVVLTNGRAEEMKDIEATCAMEAKLDGASTT